MSGPVDATVITLPFPPSLNSIWRSVVVRGRVQVLLSAQGRAYRNRVIEQVARAGRVPLTQRLGVELYVCPPDRRARDLSNIPKALEDALTHARFWADDSLIDDLRVVRGPVCRGGSVRVTVWPMRPGHPQATPAEGLRLSVGKEES